MEPATAAHRLEITVAEFLAGWRGQPIQLIDVREPEEWAAGHLAEAILVPLADLERRMGEFDPKLPTVIVCRSGRRSLIAAAALDRHGFRQVRSLTGGVIAWVDAGLSLAG